jgi:hypothetical protein
MFGLKGSILALSNQRMTEVKHLADLDQDSSNVIIQ